MPILATRSQAPRRPAPAGAASLDVAATTIDLIGSSSLQGFGQASLAAAEDIRLVGVTKVDLNSTQTSKPAAEDLRATGELKIAGDLNLTASQIYPTTLSSFTLNAEGSDSRMTFAGNGNTVHTPLTAGGSLTAKAAHIVQGGRVVAPFGSIRMEASKDLVYAANSVTSVAGEGLVPFGRVENGRDWIYDFGNGNALAFKLAPGNDGNLVESGLPEKSIVSKAPDIITQAGATLDLSGGGDLYAYEFTPGPNGSRDVLANTDSSNGNKVFAINPNYTASFAPRDAQYGRDSGLQPGDSIYLSGIDGLADGNYTLLPGHYALLPGGYSVTLAPDTRDMPAGSNMVNQDGSMTVAGARKVLGAGDARTSGWFVNSGAVVRTKSEYQEYTAGRFFGDLASRNGADAPMLPADAGRIAFDATRTLTLDGLVKLGAAPGGRRGKADISAPEIEVTANDGQAVAAGAVRLNADDLNALGAESLLLGGLRESTAEGARLTVGANKVTIRNDGAHALVGPEIILAARDSVVVDSGAVIRGEGALSQAPQDLLVQDTDTRGNPVDSTGALLRVSGGAPVSVSRANLPANFKDLPGTLDIRSGAVVAATGSAYLDATRDSKFDGRLDLAAGAALGLGASRISLGDGIPAGVEGLRFDGAALASLNTLSALELNSYSTIDLHGTVNLGNSAMRALTLKGAGLQGYGDAGLRQAAIAAQTVRFEGGNNFDLATPAPAAAGTLTVQARDIEFGDNAFAVKGYADVQLNASREARAAGAGSLAAENEPDPGGRADRLGRPCRRHHPGRRPAHADAGGQRRGGCRHGAAGRAPAFQGRPHCLRCAHPDPGRAGGNARRQWHRHHRRRNQRRRRRSCIRQHHGLRAGRTASASMAAPAMSSSARRRRWMCRPPAPPPAPCRSRPAMAAPAWPASRARSGAARSAVSRRRHAGPGQFRHGRRPPQCRPVRPAQCQTERRRLHRVAPVPRAP